jgi:hypothetical protein
MKLPHAGGLKVHVLGIYRMQWLSEVCSRESAACAQTRMRRLDKDIRRVRVSKRRICANVSV